METVMSRKSKALADELVYRVAELFLQDALTAEQISGVIEKEFPDDVPFNRQSPYKAFSIAAQRGFVRLVPPMNMALADALVAVEKFQLDRTRIHVVHLADKSANAIVAEIAADIVLKRISEVA